MEMSNLGYFSLRLLLELNFAFILSCLLLRVEEPDLKSKGEKIALKK